MLVSLQEFPIIYRYGHRESVQVTNLLYSLRISILKGKDMF